MKKLLIQLCSSNAEVRRAASRELLKSADTDESVVFYLAQVQPLSPEVAQAFSGKLASSSYREASIALGGLVALPAELRGQWVPAMLDHFDRFDNNERGWIMECLAPHYGQYRERIEPVLRAGLESDDGRHSVLEVLHKIGPAAKGLVSDLLAYIGRQPAFTNEEAHLIHIDPEGKEAMPGLIRLLRSDKETVRAQAADELAAYGALAHAALPFLTELAAKNKGMDQNALQGAVEAIQK